MSGVRALHFLLQPLDRVLRVLLVGVDLQAQPEGLQRARPVAQFLKHGAQLRQRREMARLKRQRALQIGQRRTEIAVRIEGHGAQIPAGGKVGRVVGQRRQDVIMIFCFL